MIVVEGQELIANYIVSSSAGAPPTPSWWADIFKSLVAPAMVAVFFTGLTSYLLEQLKSRRESVTGLSNALRVELAELQALATEYWSSDASAGDALKEARIMSGLEALSTGLRSFQRERKANLSDDLDGWLVDLRDQLTSGGFQTKTRLADFARLQAAASRLTRMRYQVFEERLRRI